MENLWKTHGKPMEINGTNMENLWNFMANILKTYGQPMKIKLTMDLKLII